MLSALIWHRFEGNKRLQNNFILSAGEGGALVIEFSLLLCVKDSMS
jgi:hypothetical protein